jgi:hypothetical protein
VNSRLGFPRHKALWLSRCCRWLGRSFGVAPVSLFVMHRFLPRESKFGYEGPTPCPHFNPPSSRSSVVGRRSSVVGRRWDSAAGVVPRGRKPEGPVSHRQPTAPQRRENAKVRQNKHNTAVQRHRTVISFGGKFVPPYIGLLCTNA